MNPAPPHLDFEAWKDQVRKMGGRFDPQVIDPKSFAGWVRPVNAYGLMAAEVGKVSEVMGRNEDSGDHVLSNYFGANGPCLPPTLQLR